MNSGIFFFTIIKFFIYVVVCFYLYLILYYINSTIKLNYSVINKKFNKISVLTFNWLFCLIYFIFLYFLIFLKINYNYQIINMLFLFFLILLLVLNFIIVNFNGSLYFKKIHPIFFLFCFSLVILNFLDYFNLILNLISIELISILTFGFLSSVSLKNNLSMLLYLWSSIVSALIITYSISILNLQIQNNIFSVLIKLYVLFKIGVLPFGLWLFFFYKYITIKHLVYYLTLMYIINIFFVFFFINNINNSQSNSIVFLYKNINTFINFFILFTNLLFFIFFYNNLSFKTVLMLNTNITSIILYVLLFN